MPKALAIGLHRRAMTAKIIEFHTPTPTLENIVGKKKTASQTNTTTDASTPSKEEFDAQLAEEPNTARAAVEGVLEFADDISDILIMVRDNNGTLGFVTNLGGFVESMAFIEQIKFRALLQNAAENEYNPGTGDVS